MGNIIIPDERIKINNIDTNDKENQCSTLFFLNARIRKEQKLINRLV